MKIQTSAWLKKEGLSADSIHSGGEEDDGLVETFLETNKDFGPKQPDLPPFPKASSAATTDFKWRTDLDQGSVLEKKKKETKKVKARVSKVVSIRLAKQPKEFSIAPPSYVQLHDKNSFLRILLEKEKAKNEREKEN